MSRVSRNWERLVRAVLRARPGGGGAASGGGRVPTTGLADAVPPSLVKSTNIDAILQAADEVQDEDPNIARILCEQAYTMAQNLDPSSDGRGVVQFKTGLMSVIKQKRSKKDGVKIVRERDIELLWNFYKSFVRRHRVDNMKSEQDKMRESGVFSTGEFELRALEMKRVFATIRAIFDVLKILVRDSPIDDLVREIIAEIDLKMESDSTLRGELMSYNIVPLDASSVSNTIGFFPEVKAAIVAIGYNANYPRIPNDFKVSNPDMFDLLEFVFGFQKDNVRNQRENVVLIIANAQCRLGLPSDHDPVLPLSLGHDNKQIFAKFSTMHHDGI